ncbi:MAG TPA: peptidoglycan-binding domain-containing protein [Bryobacteraceae bacterium]|jgi:hypothetical protein|nr:peptidoglycan-binding domain-containing protein [Bryobacteraceae bacterium]
MLVPNNRLSYPPLQRLKEDAIYGPKTKAMVVEFQRLNGVKPDGIVGPITSFLLFPYLTFTTDFEGEGRIRGRASEPALSMPIRNGPLALPLSKAKGTPVVGADQDEEKEGLTFEVSVSPGLKHEFKPWFQLKLDEPEGARSSATFSAEAVIFRKGGFEFSGEFEFSRKLPVRQGHSWMWEGAAKGTYTDAPKFFGGFLSPLSPAASLKIAQGGAFGVGLGNEVSFRLVKDVLDLTVGGEVALQLNPDDGDFSVGTEVSGGLKLNLDVIRKLDKK